MHGCPWYDLPSDYSPYQTCYRRYHQWKRSGLLNQCLCDIYEDLCTRGGFDLQQASQNGDIALVRQGSDWGVRFAPHLRDTWQLSTSLIFLGMTKKILRRIARAL